MEQYILFAFALILLFACVRETKSKIIVCALWFIFLGILGNQVVVGVNGGRMPVFMESNEPIESSRHQRGGEHTKLKILGDFIPVESIESIVSIGDVLITLAVGIPILWCWVRMRKHDVGFFKKTIPISYPVAFLAMTTSLFLCYVILHR